MKNYHFYIRTDKNQEKIMSYLTSSRLKAAKHFASVKQLDLKMFLTLFAISK